MVAKKKSDVAVELRKLPKVQEKIRQMIKDGFDQVDVYSSIETDADLTDEEFEEKLLSGELEDMDNAAEEESWEEL